MKKKYDQIFLTNLSSFYKINLYNEIAKSQKIFVIFMSKKSQSRNNDFFKGEKNFEHIYLDQSFYEKRNSIKNSLKLVQILKNLNYNEIILGGWDSLENWVACFLSPKSKNSMIIESSEYESTNKGLKGWLKKIFISKISLGFVSGESQANLLRNVGYKGEIKKTKGVGIFNYNKLNISRKILKVKNFLYVGRLSPEKNIEQIIKVFNKMPNLELNIVGYGPLEKKLKECANKNINFLGKIDNDKLSEVYQKNDVFILPSISEPWGLVVEEALYNGLPVVLSNKVGCSKEIIEDKKHGYIFEISSDKDLIEKIRLITKIENYIDLRKNVEMIDFNKLKKYQINSYLNKERREKN